MSFEVQELHDIIRIIVLLSFRKKDRLTKSLLKKKVEEYLEGSIFIEMDDLNEALGEMMSEGLLVDQDGSFKLTSEGIRLSKEWRNLLIKREPVFDFVAGLTDGTITSLVVILSTLLAGLRIEFALFATVLSVMAVSVTNFSSFMLGGKTEDVVDILTLKALMDYSLSDIPDKSERIRSLKLVEYLFDILRREVTRSNLLAALVGSVTTFLAGIIPIVVFLTLPEPLDIILSLCIVGAITAVFLVHYRAKKTRVSWKITFLETFVIIIISIIISLIIGSNL